MGHRNFSPTQPTSNRTRCVGSLVTLMFLACGDGANTTTDADPQGIAAAAMAADADRDFYAFDTGEFSVPPGQEKFYCFTKTLERDLNVDQFIYPSKGVIHHLIVAETISPEPDGFSECDVLFSANWLPIFIAGTTDSVMDTPKGSGFQLEKGTQLIVQLHLLNATQDVVDESTTIQFRESDLPDLDPVGIMVFGNMNINLPANAQSSVVGDCEMDEDIEIFAMWPHMHYFGDRITVETGASIDALQEVYRRTPWSFDDQRIDPFEMSLSRGESVRVTCDYTNVSDEAVGFGESSTNEMCFVLAYATGGRDRLGACLGGGAPDAASFMPATCGTDPPNSLGLGATCTTGGNECGEGLTCLNDVMPSDGPGVCLSIGACETSTDCGDGGAVCCTPTMLGYDINLCLPEGCLFPGCEVK